MLASGEENWVVGVGMGKTLIQYTLLLLFKVLNM